MKRMDPLHVQVAFFDLDKEVHSSDDDVIISLRSHQVSWASVGPV